MANPKASIVSWSGGNTQMYAGSTNPINLSAKNIGTDTGKIKVEVVLNPGNQTVLTYTCPSTVVNGTCGDTASFVMPNSDVTLTASAYALRGTTWYKDDSRTHTIKLLEKKSNITVLVKDASTGASINGAYVEFGSQFSGSTSSGKVSGISIYGNHSILTTKSGYSQNTTSVNVTEASHTFTVYISAEECDQQCRVIDTNGTPVAGAIVNITGPTTISRTTFSDGYTTSAPLKKGGAYTATATKSGYTTGSKTFVACSGVVTITMGTTAPETCTQRFRVLDEDGGAISGAVIIVSGGAIGSTGSDGRSSMGRTVGTTSTIDDVVKTGYKPTNLPISFTACTNEITIRVRKTEEPGPGEPGPGEPLLLSDNTQKCAQEPSGTLVIKRLNIPVEYQSGSFRVKGRFTSERGASDRGYIKTNDSASPMVQRIVYMSSSEYFDETFTSSGVTYIECGRWESGDIRVCSHTFEVECTPSAPPTEETTVEDNSTKCIKNPGGTLVIKRLNIPENCRNGSFRIRARFTSEYTSGIWCFVQSNPDAVNRIYLDTNIQNGYIDQTVTANNVQYLECGRSQSGNMPLCSTQFRIDCMPSAPPDEDIEISVHTNIESGGTVTRKQAGKEDETKTTNYAGVAQWFSVKPRVECVFNVTKDGFEPRAVSYTFPKSDDGKFVQIDLKIKIPENGFRIPVSGLPSKGTYNLYFVRVSRCFSPPGTEPPNGSWCAGVKILDMGWWSNVKNDEIYYIRPGICDYENAPDRCFETNEGEYYAIYLGGPWWPEVLSTDTFPGTVVYKMDHTLKSVSPTTEYSNWAAGYICGKFNVTEAECSYWLASTIFDIGFLIETINIITKHENLAGETATPTELDYALLPIAVLGIISPGLPEGKITKEIGKKITTIIELGKHGDEATKTILKSHKINHLLSKGTSADFDNFIDLIKNKKLTEAWQLLDQMENIPWTKANIALHKRNAQIIDELFDVLDGSETSLKTLGKSTGLAGAFSTATRGVYNWIKKYPKTSIALGGSGGIATYWVLAIWFAVDNMPFYYYMWLKVHGEDPGAKAYQCLQIINTIDGHMWNAKNAATAQNWDTFCASMSAWKEALNEYEVFVETNRETLDKSGAYEINIDQIGMYKLAIEIQSEAHACVTDDLPEIFMGKVSNVIDGDTIDIIPDLPDTTERRVRLLGLNTPEKTTYLVRRMATVGGQEERFTTTKEIYDKINLDVETALWHKNVKLLTDKERQFDDTDRLLAVIEVDGSNVNLEILTMGYAAVFFYDDNKRVDTEKYLAAEKYARDNKLGIWKEEIKTGYIHCKSDPTGAGITIDNVYAGDTEKTIEIEVGQHTITYAKSGYTDQTFTVTITENHTKTYPYNGYRQLDKIEEPTNTGFVDFRSSPTTAAIYINNQYIGTTSKKIEMAIGSYTVTYKKEGYEDKTISITVTKNNTSTYPVDAYAVLTKIEGPAPGTATWHIRNAKDENHVEVSNAKIHVDGIYVHHYAPEDLTFKEGGSCDGYVACGFGEHTVSVKKEGYADWSKTRNIVAGSNVEDFPVMRKTPGEEEKEICTWIGSSGGKNTLTQDHALYIYYLSEGYIGLSDKKYDGLNPKPDRLSQAEATQDNALGTYYYSQNYNDLGNRKTGCGT